MCIFYSCCLSLLSCIICTVVSLIMYISFFFLIYRGPFYMIVHELYIVGFWTIDTWLMLLNWRDGVVHTVETWEMVYSLSHVDGAELFVFFYFKTVLHFLIDKLSLFFFTKTRMKVIILLVIMMWIIMLIKLRG